MPLPSVQGYLLGTRQPMNYVEPALKAYLAVSQEMRARQQQMMSDLDQGQQQFLRGREETRRGEAHEQDMIDAQVNRAIRLEDQAFQREEMGWQRELHPLRMEQARLAVEAQAFDVNVAQPLGVEMDRLRLRKGQFDLRSAVAAEALAEQKRSSFEQDLGVFQKIAGGEVPSPEPSVLEGSLGESFQSLDGITGLPVTGLKPGQVYWNHDLQRPFAVMETTDGEAIAVGKGGIEAPGNKPLRWTPIRSFGVQPRSSAEVLSTLEGVESPGDPDMLTAMDRARDASAHLEYLESAYADMPSTQGVIGRFRSLLERDAGYQLARAKGHLESPLARSQRYDQRDSQLRWAFPSDQSYRDWVSSNPEMHQSFRNLPDDQVEPTLKRIESRLKDSGEKPVSASLANDLRDAETELAKARARLEEARKQGKGAFSLQAMESELRAAEAAAEYLRRQVGGIGTSPAADPEVEAAKGYFDDAP